METNRGKNVITYICTLKVYHLAEGTQFGCFVQFAYFTTTVIFLFFTRHSFTMSISITYYMSFCFSLDVVSGLDKTLNPKKNGGLRYLYKF